MTRAEMNWKIFRSILPLIALVFFIYYTKSLNPDYSEIEPIIIPDINELFWRFQVNEGGEFLNQIIQIEGIITEIDSSFIILNHRAMLPVKELNVKLNQKITIRGRCLGYDELSKKIKFDYVKKLRTEPV